MIDMLADAGDHAAQLGSMLQQVSPSLTTRRLSLTVPARLRQTSAEEVHRHAKLLGGRQACRITLLNYQDGLESVLIPVPLQVSFGRVR